MKFNIYNKVRIKDWVQDLPQDIKPGDIGIVDGVQYIPMGWVHVSFDAGSNHGTSMRLEELEIVQD